MIYLILLILSIGLLRHRHFLVNGGWLCDSIYNSIYKSIDRRKLFTVFTRCIDIRYNIERIPGYIIILINQLIEGKTMYVNKHK